VTDLVVAGARVVDGTGAPAFDGFVAVRGDRIERVGRAGEPEPEAAKVDVCHYAPGNPHIINVSVHSVDDANGLNGHGDHELDSWESFVFDGVTYDGQGDFPGLCGDQPEPTATVEVTPTREPTQPPCDPAACPEVTPTPTRERDNPPTAPQTGGGWEAFGLALMALSFASGAGGIKLLRRRGN